MVIGLCLLFQSFFFPALRLIFHPGLLMLMLDKLMLGLVFVDLWGFIHDLNHNIPCCSALAECLSIVGWTMWAHKAFMSIIKSAGRKDTLTTLVFLSFLWHGFDDNAASGPKSLFHNLTSYTIHWPCGTPLDPLR